MTRALSCHSARKSHGRFHSDCLPPSEPPCPTCGVDKGYSIPEPYWLDAASLPEHVDIFRLADASTLIIANERLVDAVRRLGLDGVVFKGVGGPLSRLPQRDSEGSGHSQACPSGLERVREARMAFFSRPWLGALQHAAHGLEIEGVGLVPHRIGGAVVE
jgi:hypothetical protein